MQIIGWIQKCLPAASAGKVAGAALVATTMATAVTTYAYRDEVGRWRNADGTAQVQPRPKPRAAAAPRIRQGGPVCWMEPLYSGLADELPALPYLTPTALAPEDLMPSSSLFSSPFGVVPGNTGILLASSAGGSTTPGPYGDYAMPLPEGPESTTPGADRPAPPVTVPEPSSMALFLGFVLILALLVRRRRS